jgi:hypothetical protein
MVGGSGDRRLRLADPKTGVGEFGRSTVREDRRECDAEWDEKWFLFQGFSTICVPMSGCQPLGRLRAVIDAGLRLYSRPKSYVCATDDIRDKPWFWILVVLLAAVAIVALLIAISANNKSVDQEESDQLAAQGRKQINREVGAAVAGGEEQLQKLKKHVSSLEEEVTGGAAEVEKLTKGNQSSPPNRKSCRRATPISFPDRENSKPKQPNSASRSRGFRTRSNKAQALGFRVESDLCLRCLFVTGESAAVRRGPGWR